MRVAVVFSNNLLVDGNREIGRYSKLFAVLESLDHVMLLNSFNKLSYSPQVDQIIL